MPKTRRAKPYPDFPLTPHPSGAWCKKIRGKLHYFGSGSADEALQNYLNVRDDLQAGRVPRRRGGVTTERLVFAYLDRCKDEVDAGNLARTSLADYVAISKVVVQHLGRTTDPEQLQPPDFASLRTAMAKRYALSRWSKIITVTRQIWKWGFEAGVLGTMVNFGPDFKVATQKRKRVERASNGKKLLSREQIHSLLNAADFQWRAIILLAINGGLGNSDIARLKLSDVGSDWLDYPRGKTGVDRRIRLWPETQEAIEAVIENRRTPKAGAEDLLFVSRHGGPLINIRRDGKKTDLTVEGFRRLAQQMSVHQKGMGLYWLRHTFQTIGDGARDPVATSALMGHADSSMAANYREGIDDDRLRAVTNHVRDWLFGQ